MLFLVYLGLIASETDGDEVNETEDEKNAREEEEKKLMQELNSVEIKGGDYQIQVNSFLFCVFLFFLVTFTPFINDLFCCITVIIFFFFCCFKQIT